VIWCSTGFVPKEQVLWEALPDAVKDNAFLLITKTDLLGGREAMGGVMARIRARAEDQFRGIFAVSAKTAAAALPTAGRALDREAFQASGASTLITALKNRADAARQADLDLAEMLLAKHGNQTAPNTPAAKAPPFVPAAAPPVAPPAANPVITRTLPASDTVNPAPATETPAAEAPAAKAPPPPAAEPQNLGQRLAEPQSPQHRSAEPQSPPRLPERPAEPVDRLPERTPERATDRTPERTTERAAERSARRSSQLLLVPNEAPARAPRLRVQAAARPISRPAGSTNLRELISPADRSLVEAALAALATGSADMAKLLPDPGKTSEKPSDKAAAKATEAIVEAARTTAETLADILAQSQTRHLRRIAKDLAEIQDLMMLMQLERGPKPADDAITLITQIKRDLETLTAA
jgi:hypothetical protein